MRILVALTVGLIAVLALACSSSAKSAPSALSLAVEAPLAERAQQVARDYLAPQHIDVELATDPATADVTISGSPAPDQDTPQFSERYWVPVTQLPARVEGLTMDELRAAVEGSSTTWARVLVPAGDEPPLQQWWPGIEASVDQLALDQIPASLSADSSALALIPLDTVDVRVRSLDVDGVNIVFGTGEFASYPLVEKRSVSARHQENGKFASTLRELTIELAKQLAVPPPDPIVLHMTGDIIPARCALAKIQSYGDYRHPFLEMAPWLNRADITIGSLDSSLADVSPPLPCEDTFNLAAPSAAIEGLVYSGFDVITNATNHAMDCGQIGACGPEAMLETDDNLRKNGIQSVGSGTDLADARKPVIITSKGVRFAFLAYDDIASYYHAEPGVPGTAPLDEAYVREDVAAAATQADVVVVLPHWGIEYQAEPTERQRTIARAAVESGATLVLGNHPHWVEANEVIGSSFVEYALGNFVFDQDWSTETQQGAVLEIAFDGKTLKGVRYYAIHIWDEQQPRFAQPDEAGVILDRIWNASATLQTP